MKLKKFHLLFLKLKKGKEKKKMPSKWTKDDLISQNFLEFLRGLFIEHECMIFAFLFDCFEIKKLESKCLSDRFNRSVIVALEKTKYKDYVKLSFKMIQINLVKKFNSFWKALNRREQTWILEKLNPIHILSQHSYGYLLSLSIKFLFQVSQGIDRRIIVALIVLLDGTMDRLTLFIYLLSIYWDLYSKNLFQSFQKDFQKDYEGTLEFCKPTEVLFELLQDNEK